MTASLPALTSDIVSAYLVRNAVPPADLPALIRGTHAALDALSRPASPAAAVRPGKTVTDAHLISLEDGRPYVTLRRHLRLRGLTPEQYRAKWGLRYDYPMVAPAYARKRSAIAKATGLGRRPS